MTYPHDHDAKLDRILRGIANAEPREGFAQRLAANVQATTRPRTRHAANWAWALPSLCLPVVALLFFAHRQPSVRVHLVEQLEVPPPHVPTKLVATTTQATTTHRAASFLTRVTPAPVASATPSLDELAAEQMRAPSLPEPPLPTTTEARVLQRAAVGDSRTLLAELTTSAREASLAREREEYQHFFRARPLVIVPPPPAPVELSSQPNLTGDPIHAANH